MYKWKIDINKIRLKNSFTQSNVNILAPKISFPLKPPQKKEEKIQVIPRPISLRIQTGYWHFRKQCLNPIWNFQRHDRYFNFTARRTQKTCAFRQSIQKVIGLFVLFGFPYIQPRDHCEILFSSGIRHLTTKLLSRTCTIPLNETKSE